MSKFLGRRARVLIADDEPEIRSVLADLLGPAYDCTTVGSAEDALSHLREGEFDLVISDIMMGGMSGLEMIPRVLELSPDTVVIMISGVQTVESA
ncbi:MAG TPA: response regulator, partial [Pyrinomonadaceae bacterium]|nr:response regulator [Pyrinomonadaceae bacterium]